MLIKATGLIIEYVDGQMIVLNKGDQHDFAEAKALEFIAGNLAVEGDGLSQLDHDGDGKPGGSNSGGDGEDMTALRQEYQEVVGKKAFAGWDADTIRAKMAEAVGEDASDDDADAPPV